MFSFLYNLSPYYLRIERLALLCAVLLFVALISFLIIVPFWPKTVLFVIYSKILLFNGGLIANLKNLLVRRTQTAKERELIEKIRGQWISLDEQKEMFARLVKSGAIRSRAIPDDQELYLRERPSMPWADTAMIVLAWFFLLELLIALGGARWLAQFSLVQDVAALIPSDIFLKDGAHRSEYNILLLKIFKIIDIFSIPFEVAAVYILVAPFWKNSATFPISPLVIWLDEESDTFQKIIRSFWPLLAFLTLFFSTIAISFAWTTAGYTEESSRHSKVFEGSPALGLNIWWWTILMPIFYGVVLSCFVRMIADTFSLLVIGFKKVRGI